LYCGEGWPCAVPVEECQQVEVGGGGASVAGVGGVRASGGRGMTNDGILVVFPVCGMVQGKFSDM